jgi:hypothetical protein
MIVGAFVAGLILVIGVSAARGESLWGMEGIGRPVNPYDHAARGAGSTAIAGNDPFGMSFVNPAGIAHASVTQAHFGMVAQDRWTATSDGSSRRMDVRVTMGRLVLAGPGPVRWSLGYHDLTDGTYKVQYLANPGREDRYVRTLSGTGGVGELTTGLAARFAGGKATAGLEIGWANGTLQEIVVDDFLSGQYLERRDILRTRVLDGEVYGLGAQVFPLPGLSFGATWRSHSSLDLRALESGVDGISWEERASFDLPAEFGVGVAGRRGRVRVSADYNRANWGSGEFQVVGGGGASFGAFRNTNRVGVGVTVYPPATEARGSLLRRSLLRGGFSWTQLPVLQHPVSEGLSGAGVSEWAITTGCGLPVMVDRGYLDLFVEAGRTGNLDEVRLRETFVRLGAGVTFGGTRKAP